MESAYKYLVNKHNDVIQLFDPPFDKGKMNPGYIKGYVPGVRENGGQYTHAAIWLIMGFAALKDKQRTWELLSMVNPLNHGNTPEVIETYKVEPYVVAADVYAEKTQKGRGGWTWYTGSAGWLYQMITTSFIGIKKEGNILRFDPCMPEDWATVKISYLYGETPYTIELVKAGDGDSTVGNTITLVDDKQEHNVRIAVKENKV